jgi:Virulence protein RhuM family
VPKNTAKPSKKQLTLDKAPQSYVYKAPDFELTVPVSNEDAWLSQKDMALLFGADVRTISYHIKNLVDGGEVPTSTIQEIRILADDGKMRLVLHYGLDVIIPVGYRVGSSQASEFRKWANNIIKQYLLIGYVINEKRAGTKSLLRMEDDLIQLERHNLTNRAEYMRLSRVYENKQGEALLFAIIADIVDNPEYGNIKGAEYRYLFGMVAEDLKTALGSKNVRESLPDRQLLAFTLAETTLRDVLENQKSMTNEQLLEAVRMTFAPIGQYLRGVSDMMGIHHVTGQPLFK